MDVYITSMTPAKYLIKQAGGLKQASFALKISTPTIHHWVTRGGNIPQKHWDKISKVSNKMGWGISMFNLICGGKP
jgi:hypothetical protein